MAKTTIILNMSGGLVQDVFCSAPDAEVLLADWDTEGSDPDAPGLVEVTGGEPLAQPAAHALIKRLCDLGKTVLIETSGASDIGPCDPRTIRILDLKTPGSGEAARSSTASAVNTFDQSSWRSSPGGSPSR